MTILTGEQIPKAQLLIIRKRLEIELKFPEFTKGWAGALTLRSCKQRGFDGRTRKQAMIWINNKIEEDIWQA